MTTETLVIPDRVEIEKEVDGLVVRARNVVAIIKDDASFLVADTERKFFREGRKRTEEKFAPVKASAKKTHSEVCALETFALQPWKEGYDLIERAMNDYRRKQEQAAAEAQAAAAAAAKKKADDEALLLAQTAQDEGRPEEAEVIMQAPPAPRAVAPAISAPKLSKGSSVRDNWTFVVEDDRRIVEMLLECISDPNRLPELIKAGDLIRDFFSLDTKKVGAFVRAQKKGAVGRIPGVRVWNDEKIV